MSQNTHVFIPGKETAVGLDELFTLYKEVLEIIADKEDQVEELKEELSSIRSNHKITFSKLLKDLLNQCSPENPNDPAWDMYFRILRLGE